MPIAVLDFEIANTNYNSACSVGIVVIDGLEVTKEDYSLIRPPGLVIDEEKTNIHGLTKRELLSAPCFDIVWTKIEHYFNGDYIIAAHNASFDVHILHHALSLVTEPVSVDFLYFDTIQYTAPFCREIGTSLAERLAHFDISAKQMHNARATAELIIQATKRANVKSVEQYLLQHQVATKKFTELLVEGATDEYAPQLSEEQSIALIANISSEAQLILRDVLYANIYNSRENYGLLGSEHLQELFDLNIFLHAVDVAAQFDPFGRNELNDKIVPLNVEGFKKNFSKEALVEWAMATIPDEIPSITANSVVVTLHPSFTNAKKKLYTHLKKKCEHSFS